MAKKAAKQAPSVMQQLQAYAPPWEDDPADKVEAEKDEAKAQVQSLTEQLAKMQAQIDGYARQDAYRSFQSAPAVTQGQQSVGQVAPKNLDLKGLPDPLTEPDKWQGEMQRRVEDFVAQQQAQLKAEQMASQEQTKLANDLWGGFKKAQPDWAEHEMLVEAAAGRVSQSLLSRGVNVVQLMKQQPDLFYSEVAGMLEKQYPNLKGKAGADEDEGEETEPAVVFGGQAGGKGGSLASDVAAAQSVEQSNKEWLRELGEARVKSGLR